MGITWTMRLRRSVASEQATDARRHRYSAVQDIEVIKADLALSHHQDAVHRIQQAVDRSDVPLAKARLEGNANDFHRGAKLLGADAEPMNSLVALFGGQREPVPDRREPRSQNTLCSLMQRVFGQDALDPLAFRGRIGPTRWLARCGALRSRRC